MLKYITVCHQVYNIGIHSFKRLYSVYSYKIFPVLPMLYRWFILCLLVLRAREQESHTWKPGYDRTRRPYGLSFALVLVCAGILELSENDASKLGL